jgi:hypothetical protein
VSFSNRLAVLSLDYPHVEKSGLQLLELMDACPNLLYLHYPMLKKAGCNNISVQSWRNRVIFRKSIFVEKPASFAKKDKNMGLRVFVALKLLSITSVSQGITTAKSACNYFSF